MGRKDCISIASLVVSAIVVICGVVLSSLTSVLTQQQTDVVKREFKSDVITSGPYWICGFMFIIPGIIGILAYAIHKKGGFITQMIVNIISLGVVVLSFFYDIRSSSTPTTVFSSSTRSMFVSQACYEFDGNCTCSDSYQKSLLSLGFTCDEVVSIIHVAVGTDVIVLFGVIFTIFSTGLAANYVCKPQVHQNEIKKSTYIIYE